VDPNNLAYWWPRLKASGVRVPKTIVVEAPADFDPLPILEGQAVEGWYDLVLQLCQAVENLGPPCFLRCGPGSDKHNWERTCYLADAHPTRMSQHVTAIVDWAACNDLLDVGVNVWAVRELLPLQTAFTAWRGLPIACERRYFFDVHGRVVCHHPYWPAEAVAAGRPAADDWPELLEVANVETPLETLELEAQTQRVARHFPGLAWSLDWALTMGNEWYAIDMARAERSWHPECPHKAELNQPTRLGVGRAVAGGAESAKNTDRQP
jgi:hypothetical protein